MRQRPEHTAPRVRILVVRSGGFAGIAREWHLETHGEDWVGLIEACPWGAVRDDPLSRDRFVWRIEARMGRRRRTARVPDRELEGAWRELVQRVQAAAEQPESAGDGD
jgi:hypothetical protein